MIERGTDGLVLREPRPLGECLLGVLGGTAAVGLLGVAGLLVSYADFWGASVAVGAAALVAGVVYEACGRALDPPTTTLRLGGGGEVRRALGARTVDAKDVVAVRLGPLHYKASWGNGGPRALLPDARIDALLGSGQAIALWRGERASAADRAAAQAGVTGLLPRDLPIFFEGDGMRLAPVPLADRPGWLRLGAPAGRGDALGIVFGLLMGPGCLAACVAILRAPARLDGPPVWPLAGTLGLLGLCGFAMVWFGIKARRDPAGLIVDGASQALWQVGELNREELRVPFAAVEGLELRDDPQPGETADAIMLRHGGGREATIWRLVRPRDRPDDGRWAMSIAARVLAHLPPGTPFTDRRAARAASEAVRPV